MTDETVTEVEVELPASEPTELEVDTSVDAAEQPVEKEEASQDKDEDYSQRVKKRISQEVAKRHEAERRAAKVEERLIQIQQQLDQAQKSALDSGSSAVEAQKIALQRDYTDAYNSGDTDKMFEVQDKLSRLTAQQSEYDRQKTYNEQRAEQQAAQPQQPVVQQQQPVQQEPEPKAVEWARKNKWFGQDEAMTGAAYAIHNRLVNTESYDTTSDEYFSELDRRLKDAFPDKFKRKSNSSPVAAVTSRGATSKIVKLNQAQLDVCKRLGVTPEQYARFVDV